MKKLKALYVNIETHSIVSIESAKRDIPIKKLVHDAVVEYFERYEIESLDLTPEIIEKIKICAIKIFEPKNVKTKWIKNLIKIIVKKLDMNEDIVRKGIEQLIDYGILVNDYKNEVSYYPEFEESIKALNGDDD